MGLRFRQSIRLAPGLSLNLSKSGPSLTVGERGAHVTLGEKGATESVGLPGTGLSYTNHTALPGAAGISRLFQGKAFHAVWMAVVIGAVLFKLWARHHH